jgi:uncharacterized protein YndB with AHSA1/START domain
MSVQTAQTRTIHDTFTIERVYPAAPARVFAAFADPGQKRRWYAESEANDLIKHEMDFRVGGAETIVSRLGPNTPRPGFELAADMIYLDIAPDARIVFSQAMTFGGKRISAALVTMEIAPEGAGARLICTHQGAFFEGADGPQMRKHGWESLLDRLGAQTR